MIDEPVIGAALFRSKSDELRIGRTIFDLVPAMVKAVTRWIIHRRRARSPNYIVLACTRDTLELFHASKQAYAVGRHRATYALSSLTVADGAEVWDLDIATPDRKLHLTCVSCDASAVRVFETLTERPFDPLP